MTYGESCLVSLQCGEFYLVAFAFDLYYFLPSSTWLWRAQKCAKLKARSRFGDGAWLRIQFNSCTDFQRQEPQVLSPGKHHKAVGNTGIPPPIPSNRAKSLDVSEHHGVAEVGEDPWRAANPALCCQQGQPEPAPRARRLPWVNKSSHTSGMWMLLWAEQELELRTGKYFTSVWLIGWIWERNQRQEGRVKMFPESFEGGGRGKKKKRTF